MSRPNSYQHGAVFSIRRSSARLQDQRGRRHHHRAAGLLLEAHSSRWRSAQGGKVASRTTRRTAARALRLLEKSGVITLKANAGISATVARRDRHPKGSRSSRSRRRNFRAHWTTRCLGDQHQLRDAGRPGAGRATRSRSKDAKSRTRTCDCGRSADKDKPWVAQARQGLQSPEVASSSRRFGGSLCRRSDAGRYPSTIHLATLERNCSWSAVSHDPVSATSPSE